MHQSTSVEEQEHTTITHANNGKQFLLFASFNVVAWIMTVLFMQTTA